MCACSCSVARRHEATSSAKPSTPNCCTIAHAAASAYWAFGGTWLLATVGQWAIDLRDDAPAEARIALAAIAIVKLAVASVCVASVFGMLRPKQAWRAVSWAAGVALAAYGALNIAVSGAVLAGMIRPEGGYDAAAMKGHAFLWDPLFFVWGAALIAALWLSRGQSRSRARTDRISGTGITRE